MLRHICHVKNSQPGHDLLTSVNDRLISTFREDAKFRENKTLMKFSEFTVFCWFDHAAAQFIVDDVSRH